MKKPLLIISLLLCLSCIAQKVKEISNNEEMNYTFAFLEPKKVIQKEFYNQFLFVSIYKINDWLSTPSDFSPTDGEDVLDSYFISTKTADSYSSVKDSKLFKIKNLYNSKIVEVKESKYPSFTIKIEYGVVGERKIEIFKFKGI